MEVEWELPSLKMLICLERQDLTFRFNRMEGISGLSKSNKGNKLGRHANPGNLRAKENREIGESEY